MTVRPPSGPLLPALLALLVLLPACSAGEDGQARPSGDEREAPETEAAAADHEPEVADDADEEASEAEEEPALPDPAEVGANELGEVPVLMYHRLLEDGGGDYDLTAEEFRAELEWLHEHDYRPVRAADLAAGEIDVPAGTTPVVLTFDDSTREQFALNDGEVDEDTKVGILEDFAAQHDDWDAAAASFYVITSSLFGGGDRGHDLLAELADRGYEIGNHTHDHENLGQLDDGEVQEQLGRAAGMIEEITGAPPTTLTLPLGVRPDDPGLAGGGEAGGTAYAHDAVFLVGSNPAPSPFSSAWDPLAVPRIRTSPGWEGGEPDWGSSYWLQVLEESPERKYVSDGDPERISFPEARADELADAHADRAQPY